MHILANKRCASVEEDFNLDRVIVVLKHKYSNINKINRTFDFNSSLFVEVKDLSYVETYSTKDEMSFSKVNEDNFHQILSLKLRYPSKENVLKAIEHLNTCDEVLSAEPDYIYKSVDAYVPNDSRYEEQWGLEQIDIDGAWDITHGSTSVKVGIFESGITLHEDIPSSRVAQGNRQYSTDANHNHGNYVAGVIGATSNNSKGVAGVAQVKLAVLDSGNFTESLVYAANNNIEIINASFHYETSNGELAPFNSAHAAAIQNYPGLLICAAGNKFINIDDTPSYPAAYTYANIISVAGVDKNDNLYININDENEVTGSNYGEGKVHIAAPGDNILTTSATGYVCATGTSVAAPHVTGVAALLKSKYPAMGAEAIKWYITTYVDKIPALDGKVATGGRLNAYKALSNVRQYTVKYDANGGTGTMSDTTVIYKNSTPLRKNTFTNNGLEFLGWHAKRTSDNKWYYTNGSSAGWYAEGNEPSGYYKYLYVDECGVKTTSSVNGDIVIMYAHWKIMYTVSFNGCTGIGSMPNISAQYGVLYTLPSNQFTKEGYYLEYWYAKKSTGETYFIGPSDSGWYTFDEKPSGYGRKAFADGENIRDVTMTDIVNGDVITMYAHWEPLNYELGDVDMNGTVSISDATLIQRYAAGIGGISLTTEQLYIGDVDYSGEVNITDATQIQKYASGIIEYWDE